MDIKILSERFSVQKIEKVFEIDVNGHVVVIAKWSMFEENGGEFDDGWNIVGGLDAYGELTEEEQEALDSFINNINVLEK